MASARNCVRPREACRAEHEGPRGLSGDLDAPGSGHTVAGRRYRVSQEREDMCPADGEGERDRAG